MRTRSTKTTTTARPLPVLMLLGLSFVLAACGGDDDTTDAALDAGPTVQTDANLADDPDGASEDTSSTSIAESSADDADPEPSQQAGFSVNGFRYCEVLVTVEGDDGAPVTEVWGTPGVGPCEDDAWYSLDPDDVAATFGASSIHMNGPRHFTVDGFVDTAPTAAANEDDDAEVRDIGGISMTLLATTDPADAAPDAYRPGLVDRTVTMAYNAGTEVYELTDPDDNTYVMQSYALIHDRDLTEAELASLGGRLDLPDGWSYSTRVLEEDLQLGLTPEGAIVVQDELENSYQRNVVDGLDTNVSAVACDAEPTVRTTNDGVEFVRTPDACFENLPDWPYEPRYAEIDGLRQAYVDEGPADGPVVLLLHGQPSWSYLYRDMIPVLSEAGYRVIAMDHLGMGRSDKPTDLDAYSYLGHNERLQAFIEELDLADINLFVQDWGSLIGLRVAGLDTDRFASIAVGDGALPVIPESVQPYPPVANPDEPTDIALPFAAIPDQQVSFYDGCEPHSTLEDGDFSVWMTYAMRSESFRPSEVIEALTWFDLTPAEEAAYDAPFPSRIYMGGPRTFPSLINQVPGTTAEAWEGLAAFDKPFLTLWAANDPGGLGRCESQQRLIDGVPGAAEQPHDRLAEASHFLQDDQGIEIASRLADWYATHG